MLHKKPYFISNKKKKQSQVGINETDKQALFINKTKNSVVPKNLLSKENYFSLLKKLNITCHINERLLAQALIHKSSNLNRRYKFLSNNERLEYLGDAVLKLSICKWLYQNYPYFNPGTMTQIQAYVVSDANLAKVAGALDISQFIILGPTEKATGGQFKLSILACTLEAIIGAVFLSTNFEYTKDIIINLMSFSLKEAIAGKAIEENYKANLQELLQARYHCLPEYEILEEHGPPHAPCFICGVKGKGKFIGIGKGTSKKQSEQESAKMALNILT